MAEALRRGNDESGFDSLSISPSTTANPSPASSDETIDTRDPEKGEGSTGGELEYVPVSVYPSPAEETMADEENPEGLPSQMSRVSTVTTQRTTGTALGITLTGINVRDRTTREGGEKGRVFVVGYEGEHDDMNPHNWSFATRLRATYTSPTQ